MISEIVTLIIWFFIWIFVTIWIFKNVTRFLDYFDVDEGERHGL